MRGWSGLVTRTPASASEPRLDPEQTGTPNYSEHRLSLPHGSAFFLYLHQSADKRRSNATGAKEAGSPTRPHPPAKEAIGDKPEESEILWPGPTLSLTDSTAILSLVIMGVSSSRADNCTGYDALVSQSAETIDLGHGLKQTSSRSQSILFSNDSM